MRTLFPGRCKPENQADCRIDARIYIDGRYAISCKLSNISHEGAKISVPAGTKVPKRLMLYIPSSAQLRAANRIWRNETTIGVEFLVPNRIVAAGKNKSMTGLAGERFTLIRLANRGKNKGRLTPVHS